MSTADKDRAIRGPSRQSHDRPAESRSAHGLGNRARRGTTGSWIYFATGVVVVAITAGFLVQFSQADRLKSLESELASLREQSDLSNASKPAGGESQQLAARVQGLSIRLDAIARSRPELDKLIQTIRGQDAKIESLSARLDQLERNTKVRQSSSGTDDSETSGRNTQNQPVGNGDWVVNLVALSDTASVEEFKRRLNTSGRELRVDVVNAADGTLQRISVAGFDSYEEAKDYAARTKEQLHLPEDPWISRH